MDPFFFPTYLAASAMMPPPLFPTPGYRVPPISTMVPNSYTPYQPIPQYPSIASLASVHQQSRAEVVSRTVHLSCLPPFMKQKELAGVLALCGEYLRVRVCGSSSTLQNWVYGFVEFSTAKAAAAMLTHSGMELSNGPDKPALRLKCSPSKQPILDCMAYDADVAAGTPCRFGRGYLADWTLNDALLIAGSGNNNGYTVAAPPVTSAVAAGTPPANSNTSGLKEQVSSYPNVPRVDDASFDADMSGGRSTTQNSVTAPSSCAPQTELPCPLSAGSPAMDNVRLAIPSKQPSAIPLEALKSTSFSQLVAVNWIGNPRELDVMQQLAAAFQGLRTTAALEEGPLDGPAVVRRAETMTLEALTRASHLSSDTHIQDVLCDIGQLLAFLDASAAVTGGAAQTASGDCTATLPQRVTQLRMLANLVGALLCLLRRSVADAVPYVEAVLVTFAQIPPSSLLLRARQHERQVLSATALDASSRRGTKAAPTVPLFDVPSESHTDAATARGYGFSRFPLNAFIDEDVTGGLLDMVAEDEVEDGCEGEVTGTHDRCSSRRGRDSRGCSDVDEALERNGCREASASSEAHQQLLLLSENRSASLSGDENAAFIDSTETGDLCRRDEGFTRYILKVVASIGIAMESVHPVIARGAYTLANARAAEVLKKDSAMVAACLAASSASVGPRLCETLFKEAGRSGEARDMTFFPHRFFESVVAVREKVEGTRGTECFWRQLPPNHVVPLYKF